MSQDFQPQDSKSYTQMTAEIYDAIYEWKDYRKESLRLKN